MFPINREKFPIKSKKFPIKLEMFPINHKSVPINKKTQPQQEDVSIFFLQNKLVGYDGDKNPG